MKSTNTLKYFADIYSLFLIMLKQPQRTTRSFYIHTTTIGWDIGVAQKQAVSSRLVYATAVAVIPVWRTEIVRIGETWKRPARLAAK
jgi:hypothetical protein